VTVVAQLGGAVEHCVEVAEVCTGEISTLSVDILLNME